MQRLTSKLTEMGIRLEIISMEAPGCYVPKWKMFFINEKLNEEEMKLVILHEMKHAIDHSDYVVLYKKPVPLMKMESEANDYMVRKIIEENDGVYNYSQLIEAFKIGMGTDTRYAK